MSVFGILNQLLPFVRIVALLFGVLAAFIALGDLIPALKGIIAIRGDAQRYAVIAAALALVSGAR